MQPDELNIELDPDTRLQDLLTRLEDAPLRCRARLYAPHGLDALRAADGAEALRELLRRRMIDLTLVTADRALVVQARIFGFAVEELPPQAAGAPPAPPRLRPQRSLSAAGRGWAGAALRPRGRPQAGHDPPGAGGRGGGAAPDPGGANRRKAGRGG